MEALSGSTGRTYGDWPFAVDGMGIGSDGTNDETRRCEVSGWIWKSGNSSERFDLFASAMRELAAGGTCGGGSFSVRWEAGECARALFEDVGEVW